MRYWGLIIGLLLLTVSACNRTPIIEVEESKEAQLDEHILNANKYIANSEETEINAYVNRRGWEMRTLSNGTRIWEYETGTGKMPTGDDEVKIRYDVAALNGNMVYEDRMATVALGHNETIAGLETAVRQLKKGSKAKVIIPSAMAYGVVGDGEKIGSRMVMVIDLEVIEIVTK